MKQHIIKNDLFPLLALAGPLILTGLIQSSLSFFETIFLAQLGEEVMAAGAIVNLLFASIIVIIFGTLSAINILIAHKHGAQDQESIALILRDGLVLALILVVPLFLIFWNSASVLEILGQNHQIVSLANSYLHALAWGLCAKLIFIALIEFVLGLGHARTVMCLSILGVPINLLFSYALIFGKFGMTAWGIAGAGWGMTAADWLITVGLVIFLTSRQAYRAYLKSIFTRKKFSYFKEIIQLGAPIGAMFFIEVGFFFALSLMMGAISVQAIAANQIVMQYLALLMQVIFSLAQAVTVRMGHQIGAQKIGDAKRTALIGIVLSVGFMLLIALFYWLIPQVLISVDFDLTNSLYAGTIQLASEFLFAAAFFQIFEAARISLFGSLRALKDTRFSLLSSIIGFWLIPVPLGYLFAVLCGWGGIGLWWGMVAGAALSFLLLYSRYQIKIKYLLNMVNQSQP